MTNIILSGCNGKMGQVITRLCQDDEAINIVCGVDINTEKKSHYPVYSSYNDIKEKADVIIDFSHPSNLNPSMEYAIKSNTAIIVATTGLSKEQIEYVKASGEKIPVFYSANMSLGINLIISLVKKAVSVLEENFDIEIIEKHHNQKIDAPSGTAIMIADAIKEEMKEEAEYVYDRHSVREKRQKKEIGISAVRGGTIVGEHQVLFAGNDEQIEFKHTATSKEVFAVGAIKAAKFLCGKGAGLYNMSDLME